MNVAARFLPSWTSTPGRARAPLSTLTRHKTLEIDFGGDHHQTGTASLAGDHAERSLRNRPIGVPGVHVIEQILRLETQLQAARFTPQPEIFQKREIPLAESRAAHIRYCAAHV